VRDPRNPGQYLQLLAALRAAFQAMLKDPDFLAATKSATRWSIRDRRGDGSDHT
jgi:hypothetical protein